MSIIGEAKDVTACLLLGSLGGGPSKLNKDETRVGYFRPNNYGERTKVAVTGDRLKELRTILLDETTVVPDAAKGCSPIFGVRFTSAANAGTLKVDLCFHCDILITTRDRKIVGGNHIDPIHSKLLAICRQIFPEDKDLLAVEKRDEYWNNERQ